MTEQRWHVIRVHTGRERQVVEAIEAQRFDRRRLGHRVMIPAEVKVGDRFEVGKLRLAPVEPWAPEYDKQVFRRRNGRDSASRVVTERRRLFPGYVFVRFEAQAVGAPWIWLLAVPLVIGIVTVGDAPAPMPPAAIDHLQQIAGEAAADVDRPFRPGDRVMIDRDAWFGHVGELLKLDDKGRGEVLLSILGGAHKVTTAPGELVRV